MSRDYQDAKLFSLTLMIHSSSMNIETQLIIRELSRTRIQYMMVTQALTWY